MYQHVIEESLYSVSPPGGAIGIAQEGDFVGLSDLALSFSGAAQSQELSPWLARAFSHPPGYKAGAGGRAFTFDSPLR